MWIQYTRKGYVHGELRHNENMTVSFRFYEQLAANYGANFPIDVLFERWNAQPESKITGIKWWYTPVAVFKRKEQVKERGIVILVGSDHSAQMDRVIEHELRKTLDKDVIIIDSNKTPLKNLEIEDKPIISLPYRSHPVPTVIPNQYLPTTSNRRDRRKRQHKKR